MRILSSAVAVCVSFALPLAALAAQAPVRVAAGEAGQVAPTGGQTFFTTLSAFQAAAPPGLVLEDFEEGNVAAATTTLCGAYYLTAETNDACFSPGEIQPALAIATSNGVGEGGLMTIFGANANGYGNPSIAAGSSVSTDITFMQFGVPTLAVGFDLRKSGPPGNVTIKLLSPSAQVLSETVHAVGTSGIFFGVVSTEPIIEVDIDFTSGSLELIDNVRFELVNSNLKVDVSPAVEAPPGTLTFPISVQNLGPTDATGVAVEANLSSRLAYVSSTCGGTPGPNWTWNIGNLANGATVNCSVVATREPGTVLFLANVDGAEDDAVPANNFDEFHQSAPTAGPSTPASGFALYRSFPDVTLPDQNGTPFRFRDHTNQLIVAQICSVWCGPCGAWTDQTAALQAELESTIGAGNFLIVDLLVDGGGAGLPSTAADAASWKADHSFPGPVLHSEGSRMSALNRLWFELSLDYSAAGTLGIPYFMILAPGCENQVALRGTPDLTLALGEDVDLDLSTIDQVADAATAIWNAKRCAQPLVHRLDRCRSNGSSPIQLTTANGNSIAAAESFVVPAGKTFNIAALHAVVESPDALAFDIDVRSNAAGLPGTTVCTYDNVASLAVHGSWVRRMNLPTRCILGPGTYWLSLEARNPTTPQPAWLGGVLPDGPEFAFRDTADILMTGCTSWGTASECFGVSEELTELCYDLESVPALFNDGFESNGTSRWSFAVP